MTRPTFLFPRWTTRDGRVVVNELCQCGRRRTAHLHNGPALGHGPCLVSGCPRFSWAGHIFLAQPKPKGGAR